jgi:ribonuclease R
LPLITIDGETARDFDDAVFCEPQGKGWRLVVAIADVSFYVKLGDALDKDAYERGNSVYFPRRVIPMLPEALSNGLCSLNPDVERLCMVCDMQVVWAM